MRKAGLNFLTGLLLIFIPWSAIAQTRSPKTETDSKAAVDPTPRLSPEAAQVADQIGVAQLLLRIERISVDNSGGPRAIVEDIVVRQEITEKVLAASLDIDSVNAVIDSEIEQIRSVRSDLQSSRDKAQNIINIASLVTGGIFGVANTALQFSSRTAAIGNSIGVGGGAASVVLSIAGIHKQNGGRLGLGDSPRMLAGFFGRPPDASEAIRSEFPDAIWSYLNSADPPRASQGTRRDQLVAKWVGEGRIKKDGSSKNTSSPDPLNGKLSQAHRLSIDELNDGVSMLLDIRAKVSMMKRDLSEILRSISTAPGNQ